MIALLAAFIHGSKAAAQETRQEVWPEFQAYAKLNEQFRLRFAASWTRARETAKYTEGTLEADLDIGVKAFVRPKLRNLPDNHRGKYLTLRAGYAYIPTFGESDDKEHRIVLEGTARYPIPLDILVSDRSREELRWINGDFSLRYRNRLRVERDFSIGVAKFTPYATSEAFYDFRKDLWSRFEFSAGTEVPLWRRQVMEFYFLRQHNIRSQTEHVNGFGLVFQWHF
ncbi:MAG TPA: DUF2490 domain-containing protein [Blastocatellia bacterium]|nr:DUF2490 domain-containing protein [Blastocatellia bacterium]